MSPPVVYSNFYEWECPSSPPHLDRSRSPPDRNVWHLWRDATFKACSVGESPPSCHHVTFDPGSLSCQKWQKDRNGLPVGRNPFSAKRSRHIFTFISVFIWVLVTCPLLNEMPGNPWMIARALQRSFPDESAAFSSLRFFWIGSSCGAATFFVSVAVSLGLVDGGHFKLFFLCSLGNGSSGTPHGLFWIFSSVVSRFGTLGIEWGEIIAPSGLVCTLFCFSISFALSLPWDGRCARSTNYPSTIYFF